MGNKFLVGINHGLNPVQNLLRKSLCFLVFRNLFDKLFIIQEMSSSIRHNLINDFFLCHVLAVAVSIGFLQRIKISAGRAHQAFYYMAAEHGIGNLVIILQPVCHFVGNRSQNIVTLQVDCDNSLSLFIGSISTICILGIRDTEKKPCILPQGIKYSD